MRSPNHSYSELDRSHSNLNANRLNALRNLDQIAYSGHGVTTEFPKKPLWYGLKDMHLECAREVAASELEAA